LGADHPHLLGDELGARLALGRDRRQRAAVVGRSGARGAVQALTRARLAQRAVLAFFLARLRYAA
jgi:hypothetical protein